MRLEVPVCVRDVDVILAADADDDVTTQPVTAVTGTPAATSLPHSPEPELQELLTAAAEPAVVGDANHDVCTVNQTCSTAQLLYFL